MSISYGLCFYTLCRMVEKIFLWGRKWMEMGFCSRQSWHLLFVDNMDKVFSSTLYLDLAWKQFCLPPMKFVYKRNGGSKGNIFDITLLITWLSRIWPVIQIKSHSPQLSQVDWKIQTKSLFTTLGFFPLEQMAT